MTTICAVRIDERLIHGQVATLWQGAWKCTRIMVIDEESAKDDVLKAVLKISCPTGVKLSVLGVEKAANNLRINKYKNDRITIVCKRPEVLFKLYEHGVNLERITVGNMSKADNKITVTRSVAVTRNDAEYFQKLAAAGIELEYQLVPTEKAVSFMPLLEAAMAE